MVFNKLLPNQQELQNTQKHEQIQFLQKVLPLCP